MINRLKIYGKNRFVGIVLLAVIALYAIAYAVPLPERLFTSASTVIYFKGRVPAYVFLSPDDKWRIRIELDDIDSRYIDALVSIEDKRFWYHPGADPFAIVRAVVENHRYGRIVTGGSTITMQLVRLLEQRPRTMRSKIIEALRAIQLELRLSKRVILEAYLQYVPYGRNIEGIEAAALSYFGHRANTLSSEEIVVLLAVPQSPNDRFPSIENRARLRDARNQVAKRLHKKGFFRSEYNGDKKKEEQRLDEIRSTQVPEHLHDFPRHAAHTAFWLKMRLDNDEHIHTTLDYGLQKLVEDMMRKSKNSLMRRGIHNGSAVLIDHHSSEIRAMVGNFDFWDEKHGGQNIGFDIPRSPGSLLKPFIYALAIDKGMVLPDYLIADIPSQFAGYIPQNYDGQFRGLVRLEDALSWSLNIPFVNLLQRLGIDQFLGTLQSLGVESLNQEPGYYGLSAAVGGIELTPLEIANLYTMLANDGTGKIITVIENLPNINSIDIDSYSTMFSEGAAYLTKKALSIKGRPDFPSQRELARMPADIHWKTGTSFGHRDAWAAGSGPRHTAVVWLGNFDNTPSAELVGAEAAGPLLFDILEGSSDRKKSTSFESTPIELKEIGVCSYSGYLPSSACESTKSVLALTHNIPTERCPYHVKRDIDLATGLALTPNCRIGRDYKTEVYNVWPSSIRRWLKDSYRRMPQPPALTDGCDVNRSLARPQILSPPRESEIILVKGISPDRQEIPLEAESLAVNSKLTWFVDGVFLGSQSADSRLWWKPSPGKHKILVMDETGQTDERILYVHGEN